MDIKWNKKSVNELVHIVSYLKKNKIGEILENLGNYFINKHNKYYDIRNYNMNYSLDIKEEEKGKEKEILEKEITDGEYKLAFICELGVLYYRSFPNKKKRKRKFISVYSGLSYMIKFCIYNKLKDQNHKLDYSGFYLISILKDIFKENNVENKQNILSFAFFLVTEIIKIEKRNPNIIYDLNSLILESENLDLTILDFETNRTILEILKTKRTIYVRFLLILSYELVKIPLEPDWILQKLNFSNHENFLSTLTSPLIETIIFITSQKI